MGLRFPLVCLAVAAAGSLAVLGLRWCSLRLLAYRLRPSAVEAAEISALLDQPLRL